MALTSRSVQLDTPNKRRSLAAGRKHQQNLGDGTYLLYRRPDGQMVGTWAVRGYDPVTRKVGQERLGLADDDTSKPADGDKVLDFKQAKAKAENWVASKAVPDAPEPIPGAIRTVRDVMNYYIAEAKQTRKNVKTAFDDEQAAATNVLPELGDVLVEALSADAIEAWRNKLAGRGRRKTGWIRKEGEEVEHLPLVPEKRAKGMTKAQLAEATALASKRRKSSTNRNLALFKAAMNLAMNKGKISKDHTPWVVVSPFKGVKGKRDRFLSVVEQVRLVNACPEGFRDLVRGALFTGARYSELTGAKVMDFSRDNGSLRLDRKGEDTNIQHVILTEEGAAFFSELVAGRAGNDLLFIRHDVERGSRKDMKNADGWLRGDVKTPMMRACKDAQIEPLCFYELRHSYASALIAEGVPLMIVAQQLGHKDTRMVEKHYGHLAPSATKDTIRKLAPVLGITGPVKVQGLEIKKQA